MSVDSLLGGCVCSARDDLWVFGCADLISKICLLYLETEADRYENPRTEIWFSDRRRYISGNRRIFENVEKFCSSWIEKEIYRVLRTMKHVEPDI